MQYYMKVCAHNLPVAYWQGITKPLVLITLLLTNIALAICKHSIENLAH